MWKVVLISAAALLYGCGSASPLLESSPTSPTTTANNVVLADLSFDPGAVNGGNSTTATLRLGRASDRSATVALSSSSDAVTVPATVTVPAGSTSVAFPITSRPVSSDTQAHIRATAGNETLTSTFSIWTIAPTSFWYASEKGDFLGLGRVEHLVDDSRSFGATCDASTVYVQIGTTGWRLHVTAPRGSPMRPGTYQGFGSSFETGRPDFLLSAPGRGCFGPWTYVVEAADLAPTGEVLHFIASFDYRCSEQPTAKIFGEVRLTTPPKTSGGASPSRCLR